MFKKTNRTRIGCGYCKKVLLLVRHGLLKKFEALSASLFYNSITLCGTHSNTLPKQDRKQMQYCFSAILLLLELEPI